MRDNRIGAVAALLLGAGTALACSGHPISIGDTTVVGGKLSDYAGTWDGYAQAYTFMPDGSDHVRLTIDGQGQGTLQVGNAPILPPPTDPNVGYPSEAAAASLLVPDGPPPPINEGALYPLYSGQIQENRIQFGIKPHDYYAAWCALQQPVPSAYRVIAGGDGGGVVEAPLLPDGGIPTLPADAGPPDGGYIDLVEYADGGDLSVGDIVTTYSCVWLPKGSYAFSSSADGFAPGAVVPQDCMYGLASADTPIDCGKFMLCQEFCTCSATTCSSSPSVAAGSAPAQYPDELDASIDPTGTTLTGTLLLSNKPLDSVRLTVVLTKR